MQTAVGVHTACASEEVSDKEREEENLKKKNEDVTEILK